MTCLAGSEGGSAPQKELRLAGHRPGLHRAASGEAAPRGKGRERDREYQVTRRASSKNVRIREHSPPAQGATAKGGRVHVNVCPRGYTPAQTPAAMNRLDNAAKCTLRRKDAEAQRSLGRQ